MLMPGTAVDVMDAETTVPSASVADRSALPATPSAVATAGSHVGMIASLPGAANVWPALTSPGESSVGPPNVKSPYVEPVPVSCKDKPSASVPDSATPTSVLI